MEISEILHASMPRDVHSAGLDLVDLCRWDLAVARTKGELLQRVFTLAERRAAESRAAPGTPHERLLGQAFGVKEGVIKAVGGLPMDTGFKDIEVDAVPGQAAWPVRLHGELERWAADHSVEMVGGAHELGDDMAAAWAVARTPDEPEGGTP
ncbi:MULTISPECIES: 4'-phosphopantetheinyl transferase superfamily protein [unclassified Streptomyces]|uniref:4'-phosphopantetheinyl transferase superfamily protein n=1 Tax=Streptomyces sp. NBC_00060 TaxID=2975636 RepID=A0AAU2GV25_9ACTN